ncbi:hypothetical protein [Ovoidimarina sediminis]|uniref:hypothetical protein n=1 Tax=Ovoidimarina sediminis TaxID=3079856 RepID=UPI0029131AE3|nr:hypothetical protein [Rhodophyticola sp. MJ-SS7]MDU8942057.1 hypothetical protein [Rhodophyticola sp. MJ-SS7]
MFRATLITIAAWLGLSQAALAEGKTFVLAVDGVVAETGLVDYILPRFALKHGVRPSLLTGDPDALIEEAEALILTAEGASRLLDAGRADRRKAAFFKETEPSRSYVIVLVPEAENRAHAEQFADWLTGEIGQRTVATFEAPDGSAFIPGAIKVAAPPIPEPEGDAMEGDRLAHFHCGRCHVVSEKNRMDGIGSTPSFAAIRSRENWRDLFQAFWSANPHPSFTQVEGLTEPFDPDFPPHIAPIEITLEDIEAIFAYAATIRPKDLGAPISQR